LDSLTAVDNLLDDEQMLKYFSPHAVPKLIGTRRTCTAGPWPSWLHRTPRDRRLVPSQDSEAISSTG